MICNYGNMSHETFIPLTSLCSKKFGGELINVTYTRQDLLLMTSLILIPILFGIAIYLMYQVNKEGKQDVLV